ncbi:MAG: glycosyltransferase family 4 protein [Candidatus Glassbacteria bacterium]|nr:glycosyltransferase family 4 protein [Candidatus Glassbacteria bacterium]
MRVKKGRVLVVGPMPLPPYTGGIASFLNALRDSAPFRKARVDYFDTDIADRAGMGSFLRTIESLRFFAALLCRLLTFRYRLVHLNASAGLSFYEKSLMLVCCRLFGTRTLIHLHSGRFPQFYQKSRLKALVRLCLNRADAVAAVSAESRASLEHICRTPVYQVPNCVHPCFFEVVSHHASEEILYTGYIQPEKGIYELFQAVKLLRSRGYRGRVVLAGGEKSFGCVSRARRYLAAEGVEGVELAGELTPGALAELCRLSGIFVLPSYVEGQPISLLEAMAAGLPVVATAVGGIPEVVAEGENGLLVPARDPERLAESILSLLKDTGLRRRMGEQNRKKMLDNHHADRVGETVVKLYRSILAPGEKRPAGQ